MLCVCQFLHSSEVSAKQVVGQVVEVVQWIKPSFQGPDGYVAVLAVKIYKQVPRRFAMN